MGRGVASTGLLGHLLLLSANSKAFHALRLITEEDVTHKEKEKEGGGKSKLSHKLQVL